MVFNHGRSVVDFVPLCHDGGHTVYLGACEIPRVFSIPIMTHQCRDRLSKTILLLRGQCGWLEDMSRFVCQDGQSCIPV